MMTSNRPIDLPNESATIALAIKFAACVQAPLVLTFKGDIGAGKTTFIRALLRQLGVSSTIKSPTFSLVESYFCTDFQLHHFDLYRIHDESELDFIGFRDYFSVNAVCCIEWPQRAPSHLLRVDVELSLSIKGAGREMQLHPLSAAGALVLSSLTGE